MADVFTLEPMKPSFGQTCRSHRRSRVSGFRQSADNAVLEFLLLGLLQANLANPGLHVGGDFHLLAHGAFLLLDVLGTGKTGVLVEVLERGPAAPACLVASAKLLGLAYFHLHRRSQSCRFIYRMGDFANYLGEIEFIVRSELRIDGDCLPSGLLLLSSPSPIEVKAHEERA